MPLQVGFKWVCLCFSTPRNQLMCCTADLLTDRSYVVSSRDGHHVCAHDVINIKVFVNWPWTFSISTSNKPSLCSEGQKSTPTYIYYYNSILYLIYYYPGLATEHAVFSTLYNDTGGPPHMVSNVLFRCTSSLHNINTWPWNWKHFVASLP